VEYAARHQSDEILKEFLLCPRTDFDPRPNHLDLCPFLLCLEAGGSISHETRMEIYHRMTIRIDLVHNTHVLHFVIKSGNLQLAKMLLEEGEIPDFDFYYHCLAMRSHDSAALEFAQILYERGYCRVDIFPTDHHYFHITHYLYDKSPTALEIALNHEKYQLAEFLIPLTTITEPVFANILNRGTYLCLALVLERYNLRHLTQGEVRHIMYYESYEICRAHVKENVGVVAAIHLMKGSRYLDRVVIALLRQGENTCDEMAEFPSLRDALKPWSPRRHCLYYSSQFHDRCLTFLIAMGRIEVYLPNEIRELFLQFFDRCDFHSKQINIIAAAVS
jgi:hypothetical protein